MLAPTPDQLAALTPAERRWFRFSDWVNRRLKVLSVLWIATFMRFLLWFCGGRRFQVRGADHLASLGPEARALLVANHRSFFDFYVVAYANVSGSKLGKRCFFPVRASFFYESALGAAVNWGMTVMAMFPPILRRPEGRGWNRYAMRRVQAELQVPGTWVGIHPEGTRNKGPDPYALLKGHAGVGQVAIAARGVRIVPIFIVGMGNNIVAETWRNWVEPQRWPIYVCYGPDVDLSDISRDADDPATWRAASERCMARIQDLAEALRAELSAKGLPPPRVDG
jgi:1-acyl-sn-glycerol-3-phosphate acyltransferase